MASSIITGISQDLVGVYSDHFGHEPTAARTFWGDDIVVCVLDGVFSGSEQALVDAGEFGQVQSRRVILQSTFDPLLRGVVERATGSRVLACLGDVGADGSASAIFLLEPSAS